MARALDYEAKKQAELLETVQNSGAQLIADPANIAPYIGQIKEVEVYLEQFTDKLLAKLFIKGTEDQKESFHLVPLWQIVRYGYIVPTPGSYFTMKFVVGVRRVGDSHYVAALRLPQGR